MVDNCSSCMCTNGRPPAGSGPLKPYTPTPILTLHPRQPTLLYFPTAYTLLALYFTTNTTLLLYTVYSQLPCNPTQSHSFWRPQCKKASSINNGYYIKTISTECFMTFSAIANTAHFLPILLSHFSNCWYYLIYYSLERMNILDIPRTIALLVLSNNSLGIHFGRQNWLFFDNCFGLKSRLYQRFFAFGC